MIVLFGRVTDDLISNENETDRGRLMRLAYVLTQPVVIADLDW